MTTVIEASGLGKRYGRRWALADCTLAVPAGRVIGLVGPNGAGKTTLLHLAVGLLAPTRASISVLGGRPAGTPAQLARVGFVAQDTPVYAGLSVAGHLRMGAWLNPGWDDEFAERRISRLGLDPRQRAGSLSGGQRAQLALTLAIAKRPELLLLDEPVASLDPLARREFLQDLMEIVAEHGRPASCCPRIWSATSSGSATTSSCSPPPGCGWPGRPRTAGVPPPAVRAPPRRPRAPGELGGHRGKPRRQAEHTAGPHRRPDPRPGLDRQAGHPGGSGARLHEPAGRRRPRPPARTGGRVMIRFAWLQFRAQARWPLGVLAVARRRPAGDRDPARPRLRHRRRRLQAARRLRPA